MNTLDEKKRWKILTLLANGSSRRMAAKFVGCSASTITRTAQRDPEFAQQMATAEQSTDIEALHLLRIASRKDRYWRAAAWLLERRNPDDFGRQQANTITRDQLLGLFAHVIDVLNDLIPEERAEEALEKMDQIIEAYCTEANDPHTKSASTRPIAPVLPNFEREWAKKAKQNEADLNDATEPNEEAESDPMETPDPGIPIPLSCAIPAVVQHTSSEVSEVAMPTISVSPEIGSTSAAQA